MFLLLHVRFVSFLFSHLVPGRVSANCPDWFGHVSVRVYQLFPWQLRNVLEQMGGRAAHVNDVGQEPEEVCRPEPGTWMEPLHFPG